MTNTQKQCLLTFLGYDTGVIDGVWGPKSRNATECCQEDLGIPADGVWGPQTEAAVLEAVYTYNIDAPVAKEDNPAVGDFWDEIEFFDREEMRCQCGGKYCDGFPAEPSEDLMRKLDAIRRKLGKPIYIVDRGGSGVRCRQHNANVGGVANSEHCGGNAADLHADASPDELKAAAESVMGNTGGIGKYSWGIHVDVGEYARWNG